MSVRNREDFLKKYNDAVIKAFNERSKKNPNAAERISIKKHGETCLEKFLDRFDEVHDTILNGIAFDACAQVAGSPHAVCTDIVNALHLYSKSPAEHFSYHKLEKTVAGMVPVYVFNKHCSIN